MVNSICTGTHVYMGFPGGKESACNARELSSILVLGRSPRGGNGNPLQYSCLENLMGRGTWKASLQKSQA